MKLIWKTLKTLTFLLVLVGLAEPVNARQSVSQINPSDGKPNTVEAAGTVYLPFVSQSSKNGTGSWPTVAGNPQRTSWTPDQVSGNII